MSWIKINNNIHCNAKTVTMALHLRISRNEMVGILVRTWCIADAQADEDGRIKHLNAQTFDALLEVEGLADAMVLVGWLEIHDGYVQFPDYKEHNGTTGKTRATTKKRVSKHRVTHDALHDRYNTVTTPLPEERRLEKKRREKSTPKETPPLAPLPFSSPEFSDAWRKWEQHRTEIKKPIKPTSREMQLKALVKMGEVKAIATIEHTITKGWEGLREPERKEIQGEIFRDGLTLEEYKRANGMLRQGGGK